jgi:K+-sensing histidine kinase KdpD
MLPYLTNAGTDKPANTLNLANKNLEEFNYDDDYGEDLKISNELNNIISNIHGESQLIELYALNDKKSGEKPILRKAGSIQQNCLRLIKILNNISDLRKFEKEHLNLCTSNVNIVEIVENLVMNTSNHTKGKIIFDTNVEEKFMTCDINKFQKSLLILLSMWAA